MLVTHNCFKFTKNNWSRDGKTYWYRCSAKKATGCPATATVKRVEEEDTDGNIVVKCLLTEVSTPEVSSKEYLVIELFIFLLSALPYPCTGRISSK